MTQHKLFSPQICLVVEDQASTRLFFEAWAKKTFPEAQVLAFAQLKDALSWLESHKSDLENTHVLALVDIGLPDGSGLDFIQELLKFASHSLPVVITIQDDDETLFKALSMGAKGYVLKYENALLLEKILKRITEGECPLSPSIAQRILKHFEPKRPIEDFLLTPREKETLGLIAKGLTVQETALQMNISASTVSGYVKIIYQKLHISSRAEATQEAIKLGLI